MSIKAKESTQIDKARKKIKKKLAAADRRLNPAAIKAMSQLIEQQLARRKGERISLENRQITLFDENRHSAKSESKFVSRLLQQLKKQVPTKSANKLGGRVKSVHDNA